LKFLIERPACGRSKALIWVAVQWFSKILFSFRHTRNSRISASVSRQEEGRIAIVTDADAGCGGRARSKDERPWRGRRSRAVLISRRWYQACRTICRRRGQQSPVPGENTKETVKTIAQGMPECSAYLWW